MSRDVNWKPNTTALHLHHLPESTLRRGMLTDDNPIHSFLCKPNPTQWKACIVTLSLWSSCWVMNECVESTLYGLVYYAISELRLACWVCWIDCIGAASASETARHRSSAALSPPIQQASQLAGGLCWAGWVAKFTFQVHSLSSYYKIFIFIIQFNSLKHFIYKSQFNNQYNQ